MSNEIERAISEIFEEYGVEVKETVNAIAEEVAEETVKELKKTSPARKEIGGGKYRRSWKKIGEKSLNGNSTFTVFNTRYRLTHLLENGHLTRDGRTRTQGIKHIAPAEEKAVESFLRKVEEKL